MAVPIWKRKIVLVFVLFIVAAVCVCVILLNTGQEKPPEEGIILPYVPKKGEEKLLHVFTGYRNGTAVKDVKITIDGKETGDLLTQISNEEGLAVFSIIAGNTYTITATFNNSTKSITSVIGPKYVVDVYISEVNSVDAILSYETGIV
jgi:hypothetical protein